MQINPTKGIFSMLKKIISFLFLIVSSFHQSILWASDSASASQAVSQEKLGIKSLSLTTNPQYAHVFPLETGEQEIRAKIAKVWVEFDAIEKEHGFYKIPKLQLPSRDYVSRFRATKDYPTKILAVDLPQQDKRIYAIPGFCEEHSMNYRIYTRLEESPFRRLGYPCVLMVEGLREVEGHGLVGLTTRQKKKELGILIALSTQISRALEDYPSIALSCRHARTRSPSYIVAYLVLFQGMTVPEAYLHVNGFYNRPFPDTQNKPWMGRSAAGIDRAGRYKPLINLLYPIAQEQRRTGKNSPQEKRQFYYGFRFKTLQAHQSLGHSLARRIKRKISSVPSSSKVSSPEVVGQKAGAEVPAGKEKRSLASTQAAPVQDSFHTDGDDMEFLEFLLVSGDLGNKKLGYKCPTCSCRHETIEKLKKHWRKGHRQDLAACKPSADLRGRKSRDFYSPSLVLQHSEASAAITQPIKIRKKVRKHIFEARRPKVNDHIWILYPEIEINSVTYTNVKYRGVLKKIQKGRNHWIKLVVHFLEDDDRQKIQITDQEIGKSWNYIEASASTWNGKNILFSE